MSGATRPQRLVALGLGLLTAGLGGWWLTIGGERPPSVPGHAAETNGTQVGDAARNMVSPAPVDEGLTGKVDTAEAVRAVDSVSEQPVESILATVPRDALLRDEIDRLIEQAEKGNRTAACRLAWDLDLCSRASSLSALQQEWLDAAATASANSREEIDSVALLQRIGGWAHRAAKVCDDLPDRYLDETPKRMYQAASLGDSTSMARFALAPPFGEALSLEDSSLIELHRKHALDFLERSALAGEPTGLYGVFLAHTRGYIPTQYGNLPISANPAKAVASGTILLRFSDPTTAGWIKEAIGQLRGTLSANEVEYSRALTEAYGQRFQAQAPRDFASGIFGPNIGETCVAPEN